MSIDADVPTRITSCRNHAVGKLFCCCILTFNCFLVIFSSQYVASATESTLIVYFVNKRLQLSTRYDKQQLPRQSQEQSPATQNDKTASRQDVYY